MLLPQKYNKKACVNKLALMFFFITSFDCTCHKAQPTIGTGISAFASPKMQRRLARGKVDGHHLAVCKLGHPLVIYIE